MLFTPYYSAQILLVEHRRYGYIGGSHYTVSPLGKAIPLGHRQGKRI
jgi:hypothetical protein